MTALLATQNQSYRLSPARIAAYSGALAVHVVAFAFLLMPITYQQVQKLKGEDWVWVDPIPIPKVTQPPPVPVTKVEPQTRESRKPHQQVVTDKPVEHPIFVDKPTTTEIAPDVDIDNRIDTDLGTGDVVDTVAPPTMTVVGLYTPINYPPALIRRHVEGTVMLRVLVDRMGLPAKVLLEKTSGNADLDRAAISQATRWKFRAAIKDGKEIEVWAIVPVKFAIDRA